MKAFLGSLKGKIIVGGTSVVCVAAVIIAIVLSKQGYRSIIVKETSGSVVVVNDNKTLDAFLGQKLVDGDEVTVSSAASLMLLLDSDKYIYAEENSHFWVDAKGKKGNTRTVIRQDAGTNLYEIENKLKDSEKYNVNTTNAVLAVRGTVFRVTCKTEGVYTYTIVEVFEGEVYVEAIFESGTSTGDSRTLTAGEMAVIRSNNEESEFLVGDNGEVVGLIEFRKLPKATAYTLGAIIDKGRTLCVTKELLFDVVGITDHRFVATEEVVEAACTEDGYTIYKCEICGEEIKDDIVPAKKHSYSEWEIVKEPTKDKKGQRVATCTVCGHELVEDIEFGEDVSDTTAPEDKETYTKTERGEVVKPGGVDIPVNKPDNSGTTEAPGTTEASGTTEATRTTEAPVAETDPCAKGHNYKETTTEATCTKDGVVTRECLTCGQKETVRTLPATGHDYSVTVKVDVAATCSVEGSKTVRCSNCSNTITESIPKDSSNHNYGAAAYKNETGHTYTCSWCHEVVTKAHSGSLKPDPSNPSMMHVKVCSDCGSPFDVSASSDQHINSKWVTTATTHKMICNDCGYTIINETNHMGYEPGTYTGSCYVCGATGVTVVGP